MNFQIVRDEYYPLFLDKLYLSIPEFYESYKSEILEYDEDETHFILSVFTRFINENSSNKELITRSLNFINEAYNQGGWKTKDTIQDHLFDNLVINKNILNIYKSCLDGKCLITFELYL
jgi:hypothetical protein